MQASFANWVGPVPNMTPNGMVRPLLGLVLHVEQGTEAGSIAWFKNPASQVSAHFLNPKSGRLDQVVDTADKAWAQVSGNPRWISLENEGQSGDALTASQIENAAQLLAWLHITEGIPMQITDSVSVPGVGWHGMGGSLWGGHLNCPGDPIKNQRQQIIDRANQIVENVSTTPTNAVKLGIIGGIPVARLDLSFPNNLVNGQPNQDYFDTGVDWNKLVGPPVFNPAIDKWEPTPDLQVVDVNGKVRVKLLTVRPAGSGFGFHLWVTD